MPKIDFSVTPPLIDTEYAGEKQEIDAVSLEIIPEKGMTDDTSLIAYAIYFATPNGLESSRTFSRGEQIKVDLWSDLTESEVLECQLIATNSDGSKISKSPIVRFVLGESLEGELVGADDRHDSLLAQIADLELKKHWHENKSVLDKFSENEDGKPLYDGQAMGGASSWNDIQGKPTTLAGYGIANEVNQKIDEAIEYLEIASNIAHYAKYDGAYILGNRSRYHFAYNGYPVTDIIQLPNGDTSRVTAICVYEAGSAGTPTAVVVKPLKLAVTVDNTKFIQDINLSSNFSDENFTTARKDKLDSIVFNKPVSAENPLATVNDLTKPVEITDIPISLGSHISKELYDLIIAGTPFTYDGYKVELGGYDESTEYLKLYVFADDLSQINTDWHGNGYGVLNITAAGMKIFETTYFALATSGELQKLDNIAFNKPISQQNKGATMADLNELEKLVYVAHINVVANQQGQLTITFATGYSYQTMRAAYNNGQKLALWIDSFNGANVYCYLTCDAYFTDHFYFTELIKQNSTDVYPYIFTVIIYSDHNSGRVDQAITVDNLNAGIVPYSGSTTYSNGTVGKEITSLKSDITEKQDKGKATVNDVEYELGRHTLSVTDSGVTTSYNFLTAEVIENGD